MGLRFFISWRTAGALRLCRHTSSLVRCQSQSRYAQQRVGFHSSVCSCRKVDARQVGPLEARIKPVAPLLPSRLSVARRPLGCSPAASAYLWMIVRFC